MKRSKLRTGVGAVSALLVAFTAFPAHADDASTPPQDATPQAEATQPAAGASNKATAEELQTMLDDMTKKNDIDLSYGAKNPAGLLTGPGRVLMGNDARGSSAPDYWSSKLKHPDLASDKYWEAINPWMYITPSKDNAATNTRVELSQIKLNILRRSTNQWETIKVSKVEGDLYKPSLAGDSVKKPDVRDGENGSIQVMQDPQLLFHGWGGDMKFDTKDILAVQTQVQARLVVNDQAKPDDRSKAQLLVQVGTDYYPRVGMKVTDELLQPKNKNDGAYFPGVGLSRAKLVTNDWQTFSFTTVDAPGVVHEGKHGNAVSITADQLRNNPPPSWLPGQPAKK